MIITRAPLRISLGGGGTDLPSYYSQYGGYLVSAAIDKYVYIAVKRRFTDGIRVSYNQTEIVSTIQEIQHPIVRETLQYLDMHDNIEIISIGDIPANTGLGSSGSFTVSLLLALHTLRHEHRTPQQLAEEAFHIEAERLGEPIGKQDEYIAAFGGITSLDITTDGTVTAQAVPVAEGTLQEFEHDLLLFYTGMQRRASDVLAKQQDAVKNQQPQVSQSMHAIKGIGHTIRQALADGQAHRIGELMHEHWLHKLKISAAMAPGGVAEWYNLARQHGAVGGKLVGAGGGGFMLLYCDQHKAAVRQALLAQGLKELHFAFDYGGATVIVNLEDSMPPATRSFAPLVAHRVHALPL